MYVKLYSKILDSSIARNRPLRHFFTDLLLCADPDGNIVMTKDALSGRIRAPMQEVEWGLGELMKPDPESFNQTEQGRRIVPLDGCGYGWKIVNYAEYRDYKTAAELRKATAERVRKFREKHRGEQPRKRKTKHDDPGPLTDHRKSEEAFFHKLDVGAINEHGEIQRGEEAGGLEPAASQMDQP